MFKAVQKANEILSNERQRRLFDSNDGSFDDSVPTYSEKKNFYQVFVPEFEKWKRWSTKEMPSLGDESTKYELVDKFYKTWAKYQSWRDFSFNSEYDPDKAEGRDEKRWMEKQNEKENKEHKKKEIQKVQSLIESARRWDPRIIAKNQDLAIERKKQDEKKEMGELMKLAKQHQKEKDNIKKQEEEKQKEKRGKIKRITKRKGKGSKY